MVAKSVKDRVADYRQRSKDKGGRQITAYLDPETSAILDALLAHFGEGVTPVVRRAIEALHKEHLGT